MAAPKSKDLAEKKALFAKYLSESRVIIADSSSASRTRMANMLSNLGAKTRLISLYSDFASANAAIAAEKPQVLLTDFYVGMSSGLDLVETHKKSTVQKKDDLCVLVTADSSQSTVARAAEEDVDTFILKPYTIETFSNSLVIAAVAKLFPSQYIKLIDAGKDFLLAGDPGQAIPLFERAMGLDTKPTLAFFYLGQAKTMQKALDQAQVNFEDGLSLNKIHFKCLVGLFDVLMSQNRSQDAYAVVKRIAQYFPANPKRLASVLRLAIVTSSFDDVEAYYRIFTQIETRTDELVRYICSALIVTAKYYFRTGNNSRAIELLTKTTVSCGGRTTYLRLVIEALVDAKLFKEAEEFLKRFAADDRDKPDFKVASFLVSNHFQEVGISMKVGRELIQAGIKNPLLYLAMTHRYIENKRYEQAEELLQTAVPAWPDRATELGKLSDSLKLAVAATR